MEEVKQQPLQGMESRERDGYKSLFLKNGRSAPVKVCMSVERYTDVLPEWWVSLQASG